MEEIYDTIIIGAGPAGLSAGVYVARKKMKALILSKDVGGQTVWSSDVENYLGFHLISGAELASKFQDHLKDFDIEEKIGVDVTGIDGETGNFTVKTNQGDFKTKTVIIASGKSPRHLGVPGEEKLRGRGVTYCATCDAPLFKNKEVVIIGGGNSALDAGIQLDKIASKIHLINIGESFNVNADAIMREKVENSQKTTILHNTETIEVHGDKTVEAITVKNKADGKEQKIPCSGVFIEIGSIPSVDYLNKMVKMNPKNEILIDEYNMTSVDGIFACGDVTNVIDKQVIVAAGEGSKAALSVFAYLAKKK